MSLLLVMCLLYFFANALAIVILVQLGGVLQYIVALCLLIGMIMITAAVMFALTDVKVKKGEKHE